MQHSDVTVDQFTFGELGKAARDAAGWHECLDHLARALDGAEIPAWGDVWRAVHPRYFDALGPDASTIGPPAGSEEAADSRA